MCVTRKIFLFCVLSIVVAKEIKYKAAVVEYGGLNTVSNFKQHFFDNVREYRWLLKAATKQNVDIIVFPESTLNTPSSLDRKLLADFAIQVPEPVDKKAPCDDKKYSNELSELSCSVRDSKLYAVMNILEKYPCKPGSKDKKYEKCPSDGFYLFNSNVVFDRDGRIISRYRKTHHFGESYLNKLQQPEIETFETDFGVTFGHIICFDGLFYQPTHDLLKKGVKNFVYPLMWFSELPFLTGVQFESAWSQAYGVNLLASGASIPTQGSTGSGIFAGKSGTKTAIIVGTSESKVITADVYANPEIKSEETFVVESSESGQIRMMKDSLQFYDWNFVDLSKSRHGYNETVCSDDFCCSFYLKTKQSVEPSGLYYQYAMIAFDGVRSFAGKASGGVQNCGLVACTSDDFTTCGTRFPPEKSFQPFVTFETVKISSIFDSKNSTHMPVSITHELLPTKHADSSFAKIKRASDVKIVYELTKAHDDLLTFGIFGRKFSHDDDPVSKKSPVLENARKGRKALMLNENVLQNQTDRLNRSSFIKPEESESSADDIFSYIWEKLRIILVIFAVYILEMM